VFSYRLWLKALGALLTNLRRRPCTEQEEVDIKRTEEEEGRGGSRIGGMGRKLEEAEESDELSEEAKREGEEQRRND
jgi:hypothetical protein